MSKKLVLLACAVAAFSTAAITAQADETNPVIVHRQGIYKQVSGHMNGLKAALFLKGGTENLVWDAENIVDSFKHMGAAYPEGSDKGETKAKSNIWTERAKFDDAGKKAFGAALALVDVTKTGDVAKSADAFKALGAACKACHEDFKKD
ncbi:MAG: cytochrome c [Rhodospirillaceae bacterium]|nr:cytochrome c [Rhodospirillales bacterium]